MIREHIDMVEQLFLSVFHLKSIPKVAMFTLLRQNIVWKKPNNTEIYTYG